MSTNGVVPHHPAPSPVMTARPAPFRPPGHADRNGRYVAGPDGAPAGLHCPRCGGPTVSQRSSRRNFPEAIVRRPHCLDCGYRWNTLELPVRAAPVRHAGYGWLRVIAAFRAVADLLEPHQPRARGLVGAATRARLATRRTPHSEEQLTRDRAFALEQLEVLHGAESLGTLLALYRLRARASRAALATQAGVDVTFLSRIEADQRAPSRAIVRALAAALALADEERDRLLVAGGYAPLVLERLGWPSALHAAARVLATGS